MYSFTHTVPAGPPLNIEAFAMDSTTLQLEWEPPLPELQNGLILDYTVNISEIETGNMFHLASGGLTTINVPSLHPFYTYAYIIAASTEIGRGPYSVSNTIRMPEDGESVNHNNYTYS